MASIYDIDNWSSGDKPGWGKNTVVRGANTTYPSTLGNFYYALNDNISANATNYDPQGASGSTYWGGYTTYNNATVPHFFWIADYGASIESEPKVDVIQFGDGYEQRTPQNISADLLKLSLSFDKRDEKEVTAIAHFLHTRGAKEAFAFTPPSPYGSMKKFICRSWDVTMNFHNSFSVKVSFEEVVS